MGDQLCQLLPNAGLRYCYNLLYRLRFSNRFYQPNSFVLQQIIRPVLDHFCWASSSKWACLNQSFSVIFFWFSFSFPSCEYSNFLYYPKKFKLERFQFKQWYHPPVWFIWTKNSRFLPNSSIGLPNTVLFEPKSSRFWTFWFCPLR